RATWGIGRPKRQCRRCVVQDAGGPQSHSGGKGFAPVQHRRTAAVHQCADWGDERGRTPPAATERSRDLRPPSAAPAAGTSRHYRTVADQWPIRPVMGRLGAAGPVLRGELVDAKRFGDRGEDRRGSPWWIGCILSGQSDHTVASFPTTQQTKRARKGNPCN